MASHSAPPARPCWRCTRAPSAPSEGLDAGLDDLAIHLPDAGEFARVLARLIVARVPQSPTITTSQATYLHDPDGIMLELTLDKSERFRSLEIGRDAVGMYDNQGRLRRPTKALDVEAALLEPR